ncbi:MAG: MMPL family transporter, partial [Pseudomonadota bacterium]
LPFASRVDSVTNFQATRAEGDELIVEDLVKNPAERSAAEIAARKEIALAEPLLVNQLLPEDAAVTAVNVVLQLPGESSTEVPSAVGEARLLRDRILAEHPGLEIWMSGTSMMNNSFSESAQRDMSTLIPLMFFVILVAALVALRSGSGALACFLIIVLSVAAAIGAAGMMSVALTAISIGAFIVVMTLAVADTIHILISMRAAMRDGMDKISALVEAMRINFLAVSITSLTTIVGFMALNFSDSPPFWHLGNITAAGVLAAWFFSITFLPAVVSLLPFKAPSKTADRGERALLSIAEFVIRYRRGTLLVMTVIGLGLVSLAARLETNDAFVEYFHPVLEFRSDTDRVAEHLGIYPLEFKVPTGETGGVADPDFLKRVDAFATWLREIPEVQHVYSFTDIIKRLNMNMHGDDPSYYRIPDDRELAAQYLLLYELSLPLGLDLNDRIDIDKAITRVSASVVPHTTQRTKEMLKEVEVYMAANFPPDLPATPTSTQVMFTFIADRNIEAMFVGTLLAVGVIAIIMALSTSSVSLGALSIVTNGLPIAATFGVWAILFGEVGFTVATVATISLGIIVDDTVHFLTKYRRARREDGKSPEDAIRYAFRTVGMALVVNTTVLVFGFLMLTMSSFRPNADMGLLTVIAITLALIFDFLLLPALLLIGKSKERATEPQAAPQAA